MNTYRTALSYVVRSMLIVVLKQGGYSIMALLPHPLDAINDAVKLHIVRQDA